MRSRLLRTVIMGVATSLIITGCMLSRTVDHAFLGWSVPHPKYENRKVTGVILLPVSFALDVVTLPVQAVLVAIFGDNFPFGNSNQVSALNDDPLFQKLSNERKTLAHAEFRRLLDSGAVSRGSVLVLCNDGHWMAITINEGQREQLLARSGAAAPKKLAYSQ